MLPQQYCLRWKYHHSNLQNMFSQLLDRGCFCDVTLACEGQLIRAHRVVLCACSTFFDTVLTNYASERDPIIIMKDVTFADVKCLIEFMYKGEINVEHVHLASLLKTADDLKIKGLAEVSWREDDDGPPPPAPATEFHSPKRAQELYAHEQQRTTSPLMGERERKSLSPAAAAMRAAPTTRLPTLTPIPATNSISIAAAPGPVDYYMGPKRKRGRPPLDDAYDVFNVRKMAHYASVHQQEHQAYLEARHYGADEHRPQHATAAVASPPSAAAAVAAYQQHVHQQQTKQRLRHRQRRELEAEEVAELDDAQPDPEWITSNLEVNVSECEHGSTENGSVNVEVDVKEHKAELAEPMLSHKKLDKKHREKTPEQREALQAHGRAARKNSNESREQHGEVQELKRQRVDDAEGDAEEESNQQEEAATVPQPVEEIESVRQVLEQQLSAPAAAAANSSSCSTTSAASSNASQKSAQAHAHNAAAQPALHHPHYGAKYAAEGYLLNEHGMLMTHDFVHAPTVSIPVAPVPVSTSTTSGAAGAAAVTGNGAEHEFADIKMEDYDAADLRLTSEEMSQWQDVIKMDDYLAKGRRPQFWEEPFTRRVLDAIKNKRLEMKKAARILGVSYGTLYGRYREVYGCLKHPYSSTTFRPSQSSQQLAVQPRFDMVWPSPKRDSSGAALTGHLEIGKIRPKDLSELWPRPQI